MFLFAQNTFVENRRLFPDFYVNYEFVTNQSVDILRTRHLNDEKLGLILQKSFLSLVQNNKKTAIRIKFEIHKSVIIL